MIFGIDISKYEGDINWESIHPSEDQPEISYCFCRSSYGDTTNNPLHAIDPKFKANWRGAIDSGLIVGAYHYFLPKENMDGIRLQADTFINQVKNAIRATDINYLPAAIDIEEPKHNVKAEDYVRGIQTWIELVEADPLFKGMPTIIYTTKLVWESLNNPNSFSDHPLWVADWSENSPRLPTSWINWVFFQYTENGTYGPLNTIDMNKFNGDKEKLLNLTRARTNHI